jgi:hypothetical protein
MTQITITDIGRIFSDYQNVNDAIKEVKTQIALRGLVLTCNVLDINHRSCCKTPTGRCRSFRKLETYCYHMRSVHSVSMEQIIEMSIYDYEQSRNNHLQNDESKKTYYFIVIFIFIF